MRTRLTKWCSNYKSSRFLSALSDVSLHYDESVKLRPIKVWYWDQTKIHVQDVGVKIAKGGSELQVNIRRSTAQSDTQFSDPDTPVTIIAFCLLMFDRQSVQCKAS